MFSNILRGVWHYRRINVIVAAAVGIATAVIGGSLIVGDSVRYSLQEMTLARLGQVTHLIQSHRFVREELAGEIEAAWRSEAEESARSALFAPVIMLPGAVEAADEIGATRRAGSVTLVGINDSAWQLLETASIPVPTGRQIVLGHRTADALGVAQGAEVSVWVELPASIPRDSLLGEREDINVEIVLTVSHVIPEDVGASRFRVQPSQQLAFNAFLPLATFQERLGLEAIAASRRTPVAKPARVNTILVGFPENVTLLTASMPGDEIEAAIAEHAQLLRRSEHLFGNVDDVVQSRLTLADLGIEIRPIADRGYVSVQSDRMILEDSLSAAARTAADQLGLVASPTLVYLANEISAADRTNPDSLYSMYSIIAGLPFDDEPPLGPFQLIDGTQAPNPAADEILLSSWLAQDLQSEVGDTVTVAWHEVGSHGELPEITKSFRVLGILAEDAVTVDRHLVPSVKGITDVESFSDWDQPFEMDIKRVTPRDDDYWARFKAAPKCFVALNTAEELWRSRYGQYTSIRIATTTGSEQITEAQLSSVVDRLSFEIPRQVTPAELGLSLQSIRADGLRAAMGANDFTQLFVGFSFFLILSAIILASLMFKLGIQRRVAQVGLLLALGWPESRVQRLFMAEGIVVSILGTIAGCFGAVYFARLMVHGLTTWWVDAVGTQSLQLDLQPPRLMVAAGITLVLVIVVIRRAVTSYRSVAPTVLLSGRVEEPFVETNSVRPASANLLTWCGRLSVMAAIAIPAAVIGGYLPNGEAFGGLSWKVVCFFLAGFSCLTGGLHLLNGRLKNRGTGETVKASAGGVFTLALANAARSPQRSLLTTALIAFATFVIVAVGAGRRNPLSETPDRNSGNGGFSLVAESSQPVLFDLNTTQGRSRLGFNAAGGSSLEDDVHVYSFAVKPGSDASCVNLYQTRIPQLLGASTAFIERGGFRFADTPGENPWQLLTQQVDDVTGVPVIPVIGDMNTLQYSLKKGIGDTIMVPDDKSPKYALKVVGLLDGSVLQGVLVMTADNLLRIEPEISGFRYFLIEVPDDGSTQEIVTSMESTLNDYGFDAQPVSERLAGFLAVQNTYLSTFQMLGGLGLLVGTFGLAAVMMRNVEDRRREIALLKSIGFTGTRISRLIVTENCVLLLWGIILGSSSAFLAMLPHLSSTGADIQWNLLVITLGAVVLIGSSASLFAVISALGTSVRESLSAD